MDSSTPSISSSTYTAQESALLATFEAICIKHEIDVLVNPLQYEIKSPCAVDVEHDEEGNLVGIGVFDGTSALYFTTVSERLRTSLLSLSFIAHNGKGDFDSLRQWGISVSDAQLMWDTELISHIIDSSRKGYGLKKLAKEDLGIEYPDYAAIVGKRAAKVRRTLDHWPVAIVSRYNAVDTYCTYHLFLKQKQQVPDYV